MLVTGNARHFPTISGTPLSQSRVTIATIYGRLTIDEGQTHFSREEAGWSPSRNLGGVVELKVSNLPRSGKYPGGCKFSLFLVSQGEMLVGIDNHQPKGAHVHLGGEQFPFHYTDDEQLLKEFWDLVRKAGFEL